MASFKRGMAAALLVLGVCTSASAQNEQATGEGEARARFARAEQHFQRGAYAQALAEFQVIHEVLSSAGHPNAAVVLHNIALCYQRLGRDREAAEAYERFLVEAPAGAPNIEVARAEVRELRARLSLESAEEEAAPSEPEWSISPVGPIVLSVGAAALIAGAITGGLALAANADATAGCVDGHCPAELGSRADEAHLLANVTDALLFGGLAVAAAGVVLLCVLPGDGETSASAGCTSEGCAAVVRGRF